MPIGYKGDTQTGGGGRRQQTSTRFPYLSNDMLTTDWKSVKVIDIRPTQERTDGKAKFSDYTLKCALTGKTILVGVKANERDPIFPILYSEFGSDENNWVNQQFQLRLVVDEFDGSTLRECQVAPKDEKKAKK